MKPNKNYRIGLCVVCDSARRAGAPLGMVGLIHTNTPGPSKMEWKKCQACDGQGFTYFRSDK